LGFQDKGALQQLTKLLHHHTTNTNFNTNFKTNTNTNISSSSRLLFKLG